MTGQITEATIAATTTSAELRALVEQLQEEHTAANAEMVRARGNLGCVGPAVSQQITAAARRSVAISQLLTKASQRAIELMLAEHPIPPRPTLQFP